MSSKVQVKICSTDFPVFSTECVTDLDKKSVMIMYYFTFDYFESKYLFGGGPGVSLGSSTI
jgi:hypothetical protein